MICLWTGKTSRVKAPSGDFKVTIPKNSLLSQQAVTNKGILVPYTNLQLNPYPNIQLDLFYSDNLSIQCMTPNTWPTNLTNHQLEKDVSCKVFQFINMMKITKLLGYKTLQCTNASASSRERWIRTNLSLVTICLNKTFALSFISCDSS